MTILVTGGAGYIGSHMTYDLLDRGEEVVVLDNLSTGLRGLVAEKARFVQGDAGDQNLVSHLLDQYRIDTIFHFAGSAVVPDSVSSPLEYYANNTAVSRALIEAAVRKGVEHFIFSSSAAVYGMLPDGTASEETSQRPINPYGRSKLMTEWMLEDAGKAHGFRFVTLRYFNVAGADPRGRAGQSAPRATSLVKVACQVALGRRDHLMIYGQDFPTADGTGVRDYIHVSDLVSAHGLALNALRAGRKSGTFNAGYGHGYSVREVVASIEGAVGHSVSVKDRPRRPSDPAVVVANPTKLKEALDWAPRYDDLNAIVRSALEWERQLGL